MLKTPDLTIQQVADSLSVSRTTVWRLINHDGLTAFHVGRSVRIAHDDLQSYREAKRITPNTNAS